MEELKKQLEDIEERIFLLDMKDHWEHKDFELNDEYQKIKNNLLEKIKKLEEKNEK